MIVVAAVVFVLIVVIAAVVGRPAEPPRVSRRQRGSLWDVLGWFTDGS